ncbi:unnamed protein product [Protopolystoma xenopodis]|uniref:Uncharacterized protein n=1 Tax=Protopolystoma xenopodis TaxID=117903 RepID=A0A3S5ADG2_9PLAT|nr:unnamed protein product [Protopolystoma xenopodis]
MNRISVKSPIPNISSSAGPFSQFLGPAAFYDAAIHAAAAVHHHQQQHKHQQQQQQYLQRQSKCPHEYENLESIGGSVKPFLPLPSRISAPRTGLSASLASNPSSFFHSELVKAASTFHAAAASTGTSPGDSPYQNGLPDGLRSVSQSASGSVCGASNLQTSGNDGMNSAVGQTEEESRKDAASKQSDGGYFDQSTVISKEAVVSNNLTSRTDVLSRSSGSNDYSDKGCTISTMESTGSAVVSGGHNSPSPCELISNTPISTCKLNSVPISSSSGLWSAIPLAGNPASSVNFASR